MISVVFSAITALAHAIFRRANRAVDPIEDKLRPSLDQIIDLSSLENTSISMDGVPRFEYKPNNFLQRILVGVGGKTNLASSKLVKVKYRFWTRYILIALLTLIAVLLTPQLLPRWLGFKWSSRSNMCKNREQKLLNLRNRMELMSNMYEGERFVIKATKTLQCMNDSAVQFWNPSYSRVSYPNECKIQNAKAKTTKRRVCVGGVKSTKCVKLFGAISLKCAEVGMPRRCTLISATDEEFVEKISQINAARDLQQILDLPLDTRNVQEFTETANQEAEKIISRLLLHIDIASNIYIGYSMLAIAVGTPVIIFKREYSARIIGAVLGLRKANFILIVVIILTIYDSGLKVIRDTRFPRMLQNFQNDACYLDPEFSQSRISLIGETCEKISNQRVKLRETFASMTSVLLDAQLCEVSSVGSRGPTSNDELIRNIDVERQRFINGTDFGYVYNGICNATKLNEDTSDAPDDSMSFFKAFLASGILAQIMLKGVLSSWITHLISMFEPMTMHRGIVEIFGVSIGSNRLLTQDETDSVIRFARDKHLIPFIFTSVLMVWEAIFILYGLIEGGKHRHNSLSSVAETLNPNIADPKYLCMYGILMEN